MRFALDSDRGVAGFPGDSILSTQRIPRGRDRIFSTQRIVMKYMKSSLGDLVENGCFIKVKLANVGGFSDFRITSLYTQRII